MPARILEFIKAFGYIFPRILLVLVIAASVVWLVLTVIAKARDTFLWWQEEQATAEVREHTVRVAFDLMLERQRILRQMAEIASRAPRSVTD